MFGLPVLDVAIGLSYIYLLLALVVSAANELLASWCRFRSQMLYKTIEKLLGDKTLAKTLYDHPLLAALRERGKRKPSYLPTREFSLALLDTVFLPGDPRPLTERLRAAPAGTSPLDRALRVLIDDTDGDMKKATESVGAWFDAAMARLSGWYKRRVQWVTLVLALAVTVGFNVDSVAIGQTLWREPAVRAALVAQAESLVQEAQQAEAKPAAAAPATAPEPSGPPPPPARLPFESPDTSAEERFEENLGRLQALPIPLGMNWADFFADPRDTIWRHWIGWLLTVLAVSLGAPFWFGMLGKVVSIRAAGKTPPVTPKESAKASETA